MSMSTSGQRGGADGVRWSKNLETMFIDVMYEEVVRGNIFGSTFTPAVWKDIKNKMLSKSGQELSVKQLREKLCRIKLNWRKYRNLMLSDTGLGWDHENDLPVADDGWWQIYLQARPEDRNLCSKPCLGYSKLCTLFERNTASGSRARSSAQRPPLYQHFDPPPPQDAINLDNDEDGGTPANTQGGTRMDSEGCVSRPRKGKRPVLDRLISSFESASKTISSKMTDKKTEEQCNAIVSALRAIPDLPEDLMMKALQYLDKPDRRYFFLALTTTEQRRFLERL